jgi:hypothetical protein
MAAGSLAARRKERGAPELSGFKFGIETSVAANFLQDNNIKFQIGETTQPMKAPDLAEAAKAFSVYIEYRMSLRLRRRRSRPAPPALGARQGKSDNLRLWAWLRVDWL